jgi:2-dehydro-3-deoxygalactonokinase
VKSLVRFGHDELAVALVPGLSTENDGMPDVMRGEETQIFGGLALSGRDEGLFLLPGTHSKWAEVRDGRIVSFRTFMTGEVFAALKDHTILGRLMREGVPDTDGFARGVREGAAPGSAGALLNRLFATRTYGLMAKLADTALSDYLSGLLVGAEIAEATRQAKSTVTIIASAVLAQRYTDALRLLDRDSTLAPDDCVAAGHWRIARAAGLC